MTHGTEKIESFREPNGPPLPRRPSYENVLANIDKWINSRGLQKPTSGFDVSPILRDLHAGSRRQSP